MRTVVPYQHMNHCYVVFHCWVLKKTKNDRPTTEVSSANESVSINQSCPCYMAVDFFTSTSFIPDLTMGFIPLFHTYVSYHCLGNVLGASFCIGCLKNRCFVRMFHTYVSYLCFILMFHTKLYRSNPRQAEKIQTHLLVAPYRFRLGYTKPRRQPALLLA